MQANQQLNKPKILLRASVRQRVIAGLVFSGIAALFVLFVLSAHYGIGLWPLGCGFKQKYNLPCPTCGMTTSAVLFAQGKIFEAFYIQPAAALLCCILAVSAFLAFLIAVFGIYFRFLERFFAEVKIKHIILAVIIIIIAGWVVTLIQALAAR